MNFETALPMLKEGTPMCRHGWNAPAFVVCMPELKLPPACSQAPGAKVNDRTAKFIGQDTPLNSRPYFARFSPITGEWQPGWLPSQADLFAEDWVVYLPKED